MEDFRHTNEDQTVHHVPVSRDTQDQTARLEQEVDALRQRMKWQYALWWIVFILVLVMGVGFLALNQWATHVLRDEGVRVQNTLIDRFDRNIVGTEERLGTKDLSLDERIDRIQRDMAATNSELATLRVKIESLELLCAQWQASK